MTTVRHTSRILGAAFLLQAVSSLLSKTAVRSAWLVQGDISASLVKIANTPGVMRLNILFDMLTALGIIFLGGILYLALRKHSEKTALVAFGFYLLEAGLLAASQIAAFSLIPISQEYAAAGQPASLLTLGELALASMDFMGSSLHMLAFCPGGILFYSLLYKSGILPKALSLWGLITVFPCLAATILTILGYTVPFFVYLPYAPFEFVAGIWILIAGIKEKPEIDYRFAPASPAD